MTTDVFRRIVWKEYRMLRGFWVALAAFVLAGQFAASMYVRDAEDVRMALIAIMSVAVALYALGAAATAFAVEREEGTVALLQALPVQSRQLFRAKVTFAAASTVLLATLLALITWAWNLTGLVHVRWDSGKFSQEVLGGILIYGAATVSVFVCGLFFSLVLKRPLVAACLAAVAAGGLFYVANVAELLWIRETWPDASPRIIGRATAIAFVSELSIIFAIDIYLGRRWLRDLEFSLRGTSGKRRRAAARAEATIAGKPGGPSVVTAFWRLAWQEFRQAWRMMLIFIGIGALSAISTATLHDPDKTRVAFAFPLAGALVAVIGACVFLSDQERSQFRYFAERPVRPRLVWLNRQCVWLSVIAALLVVGVPAWVASVFGDLRLLGRQADIGQTVGRDAVRASFGGGLFELPTFALIAVFVLLAYSCGQLCSMAFRSGIIAGFMAVVLTGAVSFWAVLMGELGVDWRLAVAPIPFFLLFATWLRAPHWIGERSGLWPWARLAYRLPCRRSDSALPRRPIASCRFRLSTRASRRPSIQPKSRPRPARRPRCMSARQP